ncbi:Eukaryotic translation initiation factor 3 subunit D [Fasciola hepatica]|uniref:Eukaryotic translation initiation factor 3 subunit D n=1 Tax=Fasciola hepatica TaxID=6192 RepID=A0A4E0R891_FASHE|nr:Eukaryotic translation initiation factor 3 subunit D [Fasciola hepatica]
MLVDEAGLPEFGSLTLHENASGWGPVDVPTEYKDMPYQPFAKDTRLGRVADWSGNIYQDMKSKGRYASQFVGSQYAYIHEEDDSNFQLVSSGRDPKSSGMRPRFRFPMRGRRGAPGGAYAYIGGSRGGYSQQGGNYQNRKLRNMSDRERMMQNQNRRWQQWGPGGQGQRRGGNQFGWRQPGAWGSANERRQPHHTVRDSSIKIKDDWVMQEEIDFTRLSKLALPSVKEPVDLVKCGEMEYYDKSYDRVTTRNERPLTRVNRVIHTVSTTDDPIIVRLAKQHAGRVYCTDAIAASIMCCTRSVNPWDLVVTRVEDVLFFDTRAKGEFDLVSVCETAAEPPNEEPTHINSAQRLALEATYINTNLSQQMLLMYCGGVDWRSKLDTQVGAVLASEIKNNAFKLTRWTTCSILAGADQLKLGFVSRVNPKDSSRHVILGTQQFKPHDFAQQLNLSLENGWAILRCVPLMKIYSVPTDAFDSEESDSSGEDLESGKPVEKAEISNATIPRVVPEPGEVQNTVNQPTES